MEKIVLLSVLLIPSIFIILVESVLVLDMNVILKATDQLQMKNPIIYDNDDILNINSKLALYRKLFLNLHSTSFNTHQIRFHEKQTFVVFTSKMQNFTWKLKYFGGFTILVVSNIKNETDLENLSETIAINAQVYFLDYNSSSLYEVYTINNHKITKFLGRYLKFIKFLEYLNTYTWKK